MWVSQKLVVLHQRWFKIQDIICKLYLPHGNNLANTLVGEIYSYAAVNKHKYLHIMMRMNLVVCIKGKENTLFPPKIKLFLKQKFKKIPVKLWLGDNRLQAVLSFFHNLKMAPDSNTCILYLVPRKIFKH